MGERFNSGYGGYTCDLDSCSKLLWAGRNGSKDPAKRVFIYSTTRDDVVEKDGKIYCCKEHARMGKVIYLQGSLFDAPKKSVLVHAVNCQGVWRSGIAKEMGERFPDAYDTYRHFCLMENPRPGQIKLCFEKDYTIANLFTSFQESKNVDSETMILNATERAINRLRLFLDGTFYSNKFNSGCFKVPWEKTEEIIKRCWPKEWYVYEL